MKTQLKEWDKIFANHMPDKRLISTVYKELLQLNHKKTTQLKNGQNDEQTFLQRWYTNGPRNAWKDVQRREMQIYNEMCLHSH